MTHLRIRTLHASSWHLLAALASLSLLTGCSDDGEPGNGQAGSAGTAGSAGSAGSSGSAGAAGASGSGGAGGGGAEGFSEVAQTFTAEIGPGEGSVCYDFDAAAVVDCAAASATWDLRFAVAGRSWEIWTNGGIFGDGDGGAFGPMTSEEATALRGSNQIPGIFRDFLGGTFVSSPWYTYNVLGTHDISANFRVYVVDTGAARYRVQVLSYYGSNGESGRVQVRYGLLGGAEVREVELDARAGGFGAPANDPANKYAYLDLDTGAVLDLDDATARSSDTAWDLGFKRYDVIVNGGASGPGGASAAVADEQAELYGADGRPLRAAFQAMTAAQALADFDAVVSADALTFDEDRANPYIKNDGGPESWFSFEFSGGRPTFFAQPNVWWAVRSAGGDSFAKLHVTQVEAANHAFTVELFVEPRAED